VSDQKQVHRSDLALRAAQRHQQLFDEPARMHPLDRKTNADQIIDATTRLKNAVACKDGPRIPLASCPQMIATLLTHPELWDRFSMLSAQIQCAEAKLPVALRQLAIMRTLWLCGAPYQWGEHIAKTRAAGFDDDAIERIRIGSSAPGWSALEVAVLQAAEGYCDDHFVNNDTWAVLARELDSLQLFELLVVIGQFASVAFVLNALRIPLEGSNPGFL